MTMRTMQTHHMVSTSLWNVQGRTSRRREVSIFRAARDSRPVPMMTCSISTRSQGPKWRQ
jgi:hypothetical protein